MPFGRLEVGDAPPPSSTSPAPGGHDSRRTPAARSCARTQPCPKPPPLPIPPPPPPQELPHRLAPQTRRLYGMKPRSGENTPLRSTKWGAKGHTARPLPPRHKKAEATAILSSSAPWCAIKNSRQGGAGGGGRGGGGRVVPQPLAARRGSAMPPHGGSLLPRVRLHAWKGKRVARRAPAAAVAAEQQTAAARHEVGEREPHGARPPARGTGKEPPHHPSVGTAGRGAVK